MSERLPERLEAESCRLRDEGGFSVGVINTSHGSLGHDIAMARRLAACYRACAGIPTDRLEWACQGASDSHRLARLESELHRAALAGLDRQLEAVGVANTPGRQIP
jgi:hypothetical protein